MTEIYPTPHQEPVTVHLSSERDVLALALHLLGYWPEKSIMVLALSSGGVGPLLRVDMPDMSDVAPDDFLTYIFDAFPTHTPEGELITSVFLLLFASGAASGKVDISVERTFLETAQRYAELASAHATQHGVILLDVLAVGQEAYWAVNPEEGKLSPAGFLEEVVTSPLYTELVAHGSCVARDSHQAHEFKNHAVVDTSDPEEQEYWRVYSEASSALYLKEKQEERPHEAQQISGELELWERAIDAVASLLDGSHRRNGTGEQTLADSIRGAVIPDAAGFLIASLDSFATLQLVIFQACRDLKGSLAALSALESGGEELGLSSCSQGNRVLPLPSTLHRYGLEHLSQSGRPAQHQEERVEGYLKELAETLFGLAVEPPNWKRLEALEYLGAVLEASATGKAEVALIAAQAWLKWLRGNSTQAVHLLEAIDSTYCDGVSLPLHYLLNVSAFPAWLTLPGGAPEPYVTKNSR
ncbi:MAG: DUF4192 family protein [Rothia sp. (in: high G+C Gram-positive bacteria)]|uniref:DUF4192 family protein n=1 Tax=Rothia sp. (in: high G+C Gram-positive bacteria) TaxID=1885016 RepID=UPI0027029BF4|nr:DUF4192 family protein [Rothia sp. (in: high G+C Gram-positive bacteria)]